MTTHPETINGLHSCKPENEPAAGEIKTFVIEHRPAVNGKKAWIKIKSAGTKFGGTPYRVLQAEPTGYTDPHGNVSFNIEIEPTSEFQQAKAAMNEPLGNGGGENTKSVREAPSPSQTSNGGKIAEYAGYSRKVFEAGWKEAGAWIQSLPEKDREDMTVEVYYDLYMRVAQHISIDVGKIIRKERF